MGVESREVGESALQVRGLVVRYGGRILGAAPTTAVDDVTFDVPVGTTVGLVGQSGSGKSSLARTVMGLEKPTSGTIEVLGKLMDRSRASRRARVRSAQMVFQDSHSSLNPKRTIGATLAEPLLINRIVDRTQVRGRVADLLSSVHLPPDAVGKRPSQLSGGQRQRVNIARAMASEPRLLIADEPTSALDVSVRARILDLLLELKETHGLSMLFISHDLHVIRHVSDTVLVMRQGRLVESGDVEDIYRRPQHEYTRQLIEATPSIDEALDRRHGRHPRPIP